MGWREKASYISLIARLNARETLKDLPNESCLAPPPAGPGTGPRLLPRLGQGSYFMFILRYRPLHVITIWSHTQHNRISSKPSPTISWKHFQPFRSSLMILTSISECQFWLLMTWNRPSFHGLLRLECGLNVAVYLDFYYILQCLRP